jgi:uncharacterized protein (TIGR00106 family)
MKVLADFCLIPLGVGLSLSSYVAQCHRIFKKHKLKAVLHANGTNIEGEWDKVFAAVKECHSYLHKQGVPRIASTLRLGTRIDKDQSLTDKIMSVQKKLGKK